MMWEVVRVFVGAIAGSALGCLIMQTVIRKHLLRHDAQLLEHDREIEDLYNRTGPTRFRTWSR